MWPQHGNAYEFSTFPTISSLGLLAHLRIATSETFQQGVPIGSNRTNTQYINKSNSCYRKKVGNI